MAKESNILYSTTPTLEGYQIKKYIDVFVGHVVMGTNAISKTKPGLADLLAIRNRGHGDKLDLAKIEIFRQIEGEAGRSHANAAVGITMHLITLVENQIGLVATATLVSVEAIAEDKVMPAVSEDEAVVTNPGRAASENCPDITQTVEDEEEGASPLTEPAGSKVSAVTPEYFGQAFMTKDT